VSASVPRAAFTTRTPHARPLGFLLLHQRSPHCIGVRGSWPLGMRSPLSSSLAVGCTVAHPEAASRWTLCGSGKITFADNSAAGLDEARKSVPDYRLGSQISHEPDWKTYFELLLPYEFAAQAVQMGFSSRCVVDGEPSHGAYGIQLHRWDTPSCTENDRHHHSPLSPRPTTRRKLAMAARPRFRERVNAMR
jgi:hypothetical protein